MERKSDQLPQFSTFSEKLLFGPATDWTATAQLAMAMLDRVVDGAAIIKLKGKSYRAHRGQEPSDE